MKSQSNAKYFSVKRQFNFSRARCQCQSRVKTTPNIYSGLCQTPIQFVARKVTTPTKSKWKVKYVCTKRRVRFKVTLRVSFSRDFYKSPLIWQIIWTHDTEEHLKCNSQTVCFKVSLWKHAHRIMDARRCRVTHWRVNWILWNNLWATQTHCKILFVWK